MMSNKNQELNILHYWHKLEFFSPYAIDNDDNTLFLSRQNLSNWSDNFWRFDHLDIPNNKQIVDFELFLGVFNIKEMSGKVEVLLKEQMDDDEQLFQELHTDSEAKSCIARLLISKEGVASIDKMSVSAMPWACGFAVEYGLEALSFESFKKDKEILKLELKDKIKNTPLAASDIIELYDFLMQWIYDYQNQNDMIAMVRPRLKTKPKQSKKTIPNKIQKEEQSDESVEDMAILNSFYIQDIAGVIEAVAGGDVSSVLSAYLGQAGERYDLYSACGNELIYKALRPSHTTLGRWASDPKHSLSLMQQFAVNQIFNQKDQAIFSVNGPPGTGKTTLLRDVFAENIVRRTEALCRFDKADDAFLNESFKISTPQGEKTITLLHPSMTGFEMVVLSSNNSAVENLSADLPKINSLGQDYRDVGYLKKIAKNTFERTAKEYKEVDEKSDEAVWGLFSCALGKQSNKNKCQSGLFFYLQPDCDKNKYQQIWDWRKNYQGFSFAEAKQRFETQKAKVSAHLKMLDECYELHLDYLTLLNGQTEQSKSELQANIKDLESVKERLATLSEQLKLAKQQAELAQQKPAFFWFHKLIKSQTYRDYNKRLKTADIAIARLLNEQKQLQKNHSSLASFIQKEQAKTSDLAKQKQQYQQKQAAIKELGIRLPDAFVELDSDEWQLSGLWADETLNKMRSDLFVAALSVHEAWLAESGPRFSANLYGVSALLSGKISLPSSQLLVLWQSLFMIIPMVSSTFASFFRQFGGLDKQSIGYVFVDEAGQAVPQAAVGAMWRAKKAIVVGDPLQIEPVFTVPKRLTDQLKAYSQLAEGLEVSPLSVSLQSLADNANPYGAWVGEEDDKRWVGSPLRVHRRCVDPMFSIANQIAYQNKMVFFAPNEPEKREPPSGTFDLGASAWVNVQGTCDKGQHVKEQSLLVLNTLKNIYSKVEEFPPLYIITPFRVIKKELEELLRDDEQWSGLVEILQSRYSSCGCDDGCNECKRQDDKIAKQFYKTKNDWIKGRIGTVHTFQGKEESMVWLVLGCDESNMGAVNWAAAKPNLLNVALTRAKHRVFIIGNAGIWRQQNYFTACDRLDTISGDDFKRPKTIKRASV